MACRCDNGMAAVQCCTPALPHRHRHACSQQSASPMVGRTAPWSASVQRAQQCNGVSRGARASVITASASAAYQLLPLATAGLGVKDLGGLTSALGFALAALFAARAWGGNVEQPDSSLPECPRCEGTGFTECLCTRWSDGDTGCSACRGSGRMPCPGCGGGGRATPLRQELTVRADE
jgi:hypothetical protein